MYAIKYKEPNLYIFMHFIKGDGYNAKHSIFDGKVRYFFKQNSIIETDIK